MTGSFGLNMGLKSCFVVTQFPLKWRTKGVENLSNLGYMPARLIILDYKSPLWGKYWIQICIIVNKYIAHFKISTSIWLLRTSNTGKICFYLFFYANKLKNEKSKKTEANLSKKSIDQIGTQTLFECILWKKLFFQMFKHVYLFSVMSE